MASCDKDSKNDILRIILLGKTGSGKSATANSILGRKQFESKLCGSSITDSCQEASCTRFGSEILVIDTPGLLDTNRSKEDIRKEIKKCVKLSLPGPHAFILVLSTYRFTEEELNIVGDFKQMFGDDLMPYLFVLFTRLDELKKKDLTLDEYLKSAPEILRNFLEECGGGYFGIDNDDPEVEHIIKKIKENVSRNGGGHYTSEMLQKAEKEAKEKEKEKEERQNMEKRKLQELENKRALLKQQNNKNNEPSWLIFAEIGFKVCYNIIVADMMSS